MPKAYLNHFFIVLDSETFLSLSNSQFLKGQFAVTEQRTTTSQNQTWSGFYLYGRNTYIEFIPVGSLAGQNAGDCSIAFSVEDANSIGNVAVAVSDEYPTPLELSLIRRQNDSGSVPWFYLLIPKAKITAPWFETWIMEYHPDFLMTWSSNLPPVGSSIRRDSILERYKAKSSPAMIGKPVLFKDIDSISIALPQDDIVSFDKWLRSLGYTVVSDTTSTTYSGPDIVIKVLSTDVYRKGIVEVGLSLLSDFEGPIKFEGGSELIRLSSHEAVWSFQKPRTRAHE